MTTRRRRSVVLLTLTLSRRLPLVLAILVIGMSITIFQSGAYLLAHPVRTSLFEATLSMSMDAMIRRPVHPRRYALNHFQNISDRTVPVLKKRYSNILFVHVGKAGGESIKNVLRMACEHRVKERMRNSCLRHLPDSQLSNTVKGYFHVYRIKPGNAISAAQAYLYNLRHPLDRTLSWYHYMHPNHCERQSRRGCDTAQRIKQEPSGWDARFFVQCFPQFQTLALAFNHSHSDPNCTSMAHTTFTGQDSMGALSAGHMRVNIRKYANRTIGVYPEKDVLVVRTEHLWDDLKELDIFLGGKGDFGEMEGLAVTHGSNVWYNKPLSNEEARLLCCGLQDEIAAYHDLVQLAVNLKNSIKEETWGRALKRCGVNTWRHLVEGCTV